MSSSSGAPRETRHAMKLRHKSELRALLAAPAKGIGAKKKQKEDAAAMEAKHADQLKELERREQEEKEGGGEEVGDGASTAAAADGEDSEELSTHAASPPPAAAAPSSAAAAKVPSRAQKKRAAAAERDRARAAELREQTKDMVDARGEEDRRIAAHMSKEARRLRVCEMVSDGHCLYRAVADQAFRHGLRSDLELDDNRPPFIGLRQLAARYIAQHKADFEAFLLREDDAGNVHPLDEAGWQAYLDDLQSEERAVWGGHSEVVALSKALQRTIVIWSADGRMEVGEEFKAAGSAAPQADASPSSPSSSPAPDHEPLHISFHQHYYGLGAHYNSVITDTEADEAEDFAKGDGAASAATQG